MTGHAACRVVEEFIVHRLQEARQNDGLGPVDETLFRSLTLGTAAQLATVDQLISQTLAEDWRLERLETTVLAVLRVGTHELLSDAGVPHAVVINEYVDLTNALNSERAAGLVNGILDNIAKYARGDAGGSAPVGDTSPNPEC